MTDPVRSLDRYRDIVEDFDTFVEFCRKPLPVCYWVNTLRTTSEEVNERLRRDGFRMTPLTWLADAFKLEPTEHSLGRRFEHKAGLINIQEEVSMAPVVVLDPQPGEYVADLCAAPGNKTSQIAVRMQNTGTVLANDKVYSRIRALRAVQERLGLINITLTHRHGGDLPNAWGLFDRVLVDAPCSCEGNSRKSESSLILKEKGFREDLVEIQKSILKRAIKLTKPGGTVVYSTCTYAPEENEGVVDHALKTYVGEISTIPIVLSGLQNAPGLLEWNGQSFASGVTRAARIYPHHNDSGGFFVAAFKKAPY